MDRLQIRHRPCRHLHLSDLASVGLLSHALFLSSGVGAIELGITAGMVAFVTAMQPMFTAAVSATTTGESVSQKQWLGMSLGIAAVALVIGDKLALGGSVTGYCLLLISVGSLTAATLLDRRLELKRRARRRRSTPLPMILLIHCASALLLFALVSTLRTNSYVEFNASFVYTLLYMAIVVSIGSYALMFLLLRSMSAVRFSSLAYLTPPATMLMAWALFGETITMIEAGGLMLAAIAVLTVTGDQAETAKNTQVARNPSPIGTDNRRRSFQPHRATIFQPPLNKRRYQRAQ